jgi:ABC-2 type transport system ATP-binding protein
MTRVANALSVKNLSKSFKGGLFEPTKQAVNAVSFDVPGSQVTGFVGANGSGKTTSLKCILEFIKADAGEVTFFDGQKLTADVKRRIGFFPERPYLHEFLTAVELLKFHWDLAGGGDGHSEAIEKVLKEVGLFEAKDRRLRTFSKGMLQRAGMAQAILNKPDLLILDEPMSGLDPDGRFLIKEIMRKLAAAGTTLFFSSHLLHDLQELCDKLVIIDGGKVLFQGPFEQLKESLKVNPLMNLEEAFQVLRNQRRDGL